MSTTNVSDPLAGENGCGQNKYL